jgi:hypothetical protein
VTVPEETDAYAGPARIELAESAFDVAAELRGHFEPIDGKYHWYGRLARNDGLTAAIGQDRAAGRLSTPHGTAVCELSDPDPWQRYRVTGTSTPPFRTGMAAHAAALPPGAEGPGHDGT